MSKIIEVKVPDIGSFKDVEIIEVLVDAGFQIEVEDSLITIESDKSSMEIPSPVAGKIKQMLVKVGDRVSEGSALLLLEVEAGGRIPPIPAFPRRGGRSKRHSVQFFCLVPFTPCGGRARDGGNRRNA